MALKVKALVKMFDGTRRRYPGEVFVLPEGKKAGKGMEVLGETKEEMKKVKAAKAPAKEPETFSEISKTLATPKGADLV